MTGMRLVAPLCATLLMFAQPASAQEYPDKFAVNIGGNYVWDSDTDFSARPSTGLVGTTINFERDLDGEERIAVPRIDGYYRFTPHHRIDFGWIRFDRDGSRTLSRDITFRDRTFSLATSLESEVDAAFSKVAYTWSFHHTPEVELGLTAGVVLTDYTVKLRGPRNEVEESISEPLPTLGFRLDYAITPRWHAKVKTDSLYVELNNDLRGSLDSNSVAVEWRMARNVALGLGVERLAIDATVDDGDFRGKLADFYRSGRLYVGVRF